MKARERLRLMVNATGEAVSAWAAGMGTLGTRDLAAKVKEVLGAFGMALTDPTINHSYRDDGAFTYDTYRMTELNDGADLYVTTVTFKGRHAVSDTTLVTQDVGDQELARQMDMFHSNSEAASGG